MKILTEQFERLLKIEWRRDVQVLLGSSVLSQIFVLAAIPFVTRIYTPESYAVLATLMAISVIGGLAAPLGFDFAVPVVREKDVAISLSTFGLISAGLIGTGVAVIATIMPLKVMIMLLGAQVGGEYPWLVGAPIVLTAWSAILEALQVRRRAFRAIGMARVVQAFVGVFAQIALGLAGWGTVGLVLGYILMLAVPCLFHAASLWSPNLVGTVKWRNITKDIKSQRQYFQYTAPEAFSNAVAVHGPILLIGLYNDAAALVAHLSLAIRLLQAPSYLVAKAGSQIIQGSMHHWERQGQLNIKIKNIAMRYAKVGALLGLAVAIIAPIAAVPILGESWKLTGWTISLLVPSIVLYLVSYPLISIGYLKNNNKSMLGLTLVSAMMRMSLCAVALPHGDAAILVAFAGGAAVQYALLVVFLLGSANR
jgi:O-antigen/teichoic acid export membrane protein